MTKHIADEYTTQQIRDFLALSNVEAGDWDQLIRVKHLLWARFTSVWGGHPFDPKWTNTTTTPAYASDSNARGLDEVGIGGFVERKVEGGNVEIAIIAACIDTDLSVDIDNVETGSTLTTLTVSNTVAGGVQWLTLSGTLSYSNVTDANDDPQFIRADIQADHNGEGTQSEIFEVYGGEAETSSASDLPDGL